jgi:hypothetical protein
LSRLGVSERSIHDKVQLIERRMGLPPSHGEINTLSNNVARRSPAFATIRGLTGCLLGGHR